MDLPASPQRPPRPTPLAVTEDGEPGCEHDRCRREADYLVHLEPPQAGTYRCRWHVEAVLTDHGGDVAFVESLHREAPEIAVGERTRTPIVVLLVLVVLALVVAVGFAVIAPTIL